MTRWETPYLLGIAAAMMFHRVGSRIRLNRCFVIGGYAASMILFISVVIVIPASYFNGLEKIVSSKASLSRILLPVLFMKDRPIEIPTGVYSCASCTPCFSCRCQPLYILDICVYNRAWWFYTKGAEMVPFDSSVTAIFGMYLVHPILINLGYTGAYALQFLNP